MLEYMFSWVELSLLQCNVSSTTFLWSWWWEPWFCNNNGSGCAPRKSGFVGRISAAQQQHLKVWSLQLFLKHKTLENLLDFPANSLLHNILWNLVLVARFFWWKMAPATAGGEKIFWWKSISGRRPISKAAAVPLPSVLGIHQRIATVETFCFLFLVLCFSVLCEKPGWLIALKW